MKIISLMHENMILSSEIHDYFERTSPGSLEQNWTSNFIAKLQSNTSVHSSNMLKEINSLKLNQKSLQLSIKDFYENFPELVERYSYLDSDNILEDGYLYSQVSFNLLNREYLFKYKVGEDIDFLKVRNSKGSIKKKNELLENNSLDYKLEIYQITDINYLLFDLNNSSVQSAKLKTFLENIEYILELDNLSLANFLENNPAIKYYKRDRQIIPQILTRCIKDSLLSCVTEESVKVYEILFTQKNIYHLEPGIKINKFR